MPPDSKGSTPMHIVCVGAGLMGSRLALLSVAAGARATLIGRDEQRARAALADAALEAGDPSLAALATVSVDYAAVADADVVLESIPESLPEKQYLLALLDAIVPAQIPLASQTSSFAPELLNQRCAHPMRVFVAHFIHPAARVPLAEVCRPTPHDPAAMARLEAWLQAIGMRAIHVNKPLPGFIVNRLQFALLREALHIVACGGATVEDVETIVREGLAPRWLATGPIESADLGGLDTFADVAAALLPALDRAMEVPAPLAELVRRGQRGAKSGRGFFTWTPERVAAARARRDRAYVAAKRLREAEQT
ncbi:3-hydroxyacyl-CoA dehydrogenase family protein [bacterium]|nr:MAG: 3-hydroxyacyl-CoA dehydrogenase family protein [bacterium]